MITALILTQQEWAFARNGEGDEESVISLYEKGLTQFNESGEYELGPELRMIAEEYREATLEEIQPGLIAARGPRFCLLVEDYQLMEEAVKITLLQDQAALAQEIEGRSAERNG